MLLFLDRYLCCLITEEFPYLCKWVRMTVAGIGVGIKSLMMGGAACCCIYGLRIVVLMYFGFTGICIWCIWNLFIWTIGIFVS